MSGQLPLPEALGEECTPGAAGATLRIEPTVGRLPAGPGLEDQPAATPNAVGPTLRGEPAVSRLPGRPAIKDEPAATPSTAGHTRPGESAVDRLSPGPGLEDQPAPTPNAAGPTHRGESAVGRFPARPAVGDQPSTGRAPVTVTVTTAPRCEHLVAPSRPEPGRDAARHRVEGLLLGLASGDAAGWPAARHRAARMPEWTRRLTRELDTFAEQNATTTLPVPIALNQPPEPLRLGPSDDAEWAAFAAETVLTAFGDLFGGLPVERRVRAAVDLAWNTLAGEVAAAADRAPEVESAVLPLRARISVRAGLGNLATGLRPPATGHDNPHYFDDAACVRAVVLAVVHPGRPAAAAELAEFDARYTQDGDGVHGARAMAAAVAAALGGADTGEAVAAALEQLPDSTEIGRNARHALKLARDFAHEPAGAFALVPLLEHQIVDHVYSYGIAAAETVPVALALTVASGGNVSAAVPAAACLSRVADSAPALAGALTGALGGGAAVPATWRDACRVLAGCALPRLAGTDLVELAGLLAHTLYPSEAAAVTHNSA